MRAELIKYYAERARSDHPLFILTADLGFGLFVRDWGKYANVVCVNTGVAEQNMVGVAAGIALSGARVICYSMASFLVLRAAEQLKIDICMDNRDVILLGAASGLTCGLEGITHHALEDIAVLRAFPNLRILSPCDHHELLHALRLLGEYHGPVYVRLGREGGESMRRGTPRTGIGGVEVLRSGEDVLILSHGSMVSLAVESASLLERGGLSCTVGSCPWLKPLRRREVAALAQRHRLTVTIEEHSEHGGLSSYVAACLLCLSVHRTMLQFCAEPEDCFGVGSRYELLKMVGLTPEGIAERIRSTLVLSG